MSRFNSFSLSHVVPVAQMRRISDFHAASLSFLDIKQQMLVRGPSEQSALCQNGYGAEGIRQHIFNMLVSSVLD